MFQASLKKVPPMTQMVQDVSPLKRAATCDEVGDVIVFLCSPSASYINGTGITIDAGITLSVHRASL